jgi:hypothetical protein
MWNKCSRENDLLKCIVVTHGCAGQTEYFESGGRGHNIYFTSKYRGQQRIFSIVISKAWGQPPPVLAA